MRVPVTLDEDVVRMLRGAMRGSRRSFKETVNAAIRAGLRAPANAGHSTFKIDARPMGLKTGLDYGSFNKLVDEVEIERFLRIARRERHP